MQGVTDGSISRYTFSHDAKGFGLYQLTFWSRKEEYYDYWKSCGGKLDSAELQTRFAIKEMKRDYPNLWNFLTQTSDIFTACSRICREFERPAVNNIDARFQAASRFKHELDLDGWQGGGADPEPQPQPTPTPDPGVDHSLKLRTTDCHCSGWDEVFLLQAALLNRHYDIPQVDGIWMKGDETDIAVEQFQRDAGLVADRCVGKKTWVALLSV